MEREMPTNPAERQRRYRERKRRGLVLVQAEVPDQARAEPGFHAECFNPTEACSRSDGRGDSSTSRLLKFVARGRELKTTTQMAV